MRVEDQERNQVLVKAIDSGSTYAAAAKERGISKGRAWQIVHTVRRREYCRFRLSLEGDMFTLVEWLHRMNKEL